MRIENKALLEWVVNERDKTCLYGFWHSNECRFGLDPHHIVKRSASGDDTAENVITLCRKHHDMAEANLIKAGELREILKEIYGYDYEDEQGQR